MEAALMEAVKAKERGDYPFGAVLVYGHRILAAVSDTTKSAQDPTGHCVLRAISQAARELGSRNGGGVLIYATHEPCPMCATAIVWARLDGLVYGSSMEDADEYSLRHGNINYLGQVLNIPAASIIERSPSPILLVRGFMEEECRQVLG